jgi:hypothetical protein
MAGRRAAVPISKLLLLTGSVSHWWRAPSGDTPATSRFALSDCEEVAAECDAGMLVRFESFDSPITCIGTLGAGAEDDQHFFFLPTSRVGGHVASIRIVMKFEYVVKVEPVFTPRLAPAFRPSHQSASAA